MIYLYPKLTEIDLMFIRLGGTGLGNMLFTYARAVLYQRDHPDTMLIWPTWCNLKPSPILRGDLDKRLYNDLFVNNSGYIDGFQKAWIYATRKHITEKELLEGKAPSECVAIFRGTDGDFETMMDESQFLFDHLVANLNPKNLPALDFDGSRGITMHIRLGDFQRVTWEEVLQGADNSSIPIEWYVTMAQELRSIVGEDTPIYIFSDGMDDELRPLLELNHVERVAYGSSVADVLALSKAKLLVASGSSFSMWARYLGRMTTILFPNQVKQKILTDKDATREIVALHKISEEDRAFIKETW